MAYITLEKYEEAINDLIIAARLGFKSAQDALKKIGQKWEQEGVNRGQN